MQHFKEFRMENSSIQLESRMISEKFQRSSLQDQKYRQVLVFQESRKTHETYIPLAIHYQTDSI
jgi:hypothetical protein